VVNKGRIGLALGGGVVRGLAHVGVLSVLEREGIPVDCLAGASAGALVGAAYCAGVGIQRIREMASRMSWRRLAGPSWPRQGFVTFAKMERWLAAELGDLNFADLAIPFAAMAIDLEDGRRVVLREGRLAPAVRASCSVPGIVTPVQIGGRLLGDGGVVDNLPVSAVREMGADFVIGVDVCVPSFQRRWGPLRFGFAALETLVRRAGGGLAAADCLIAPKLAGASYIRFSRYAELITLGEQAAEESLSLIRVALTG